MILLNHPVNFNNTFTSVILSHQRSTTVSLETYPLYSFVIEIRSMTINVNSFHKHRKNKGLQACLSQYKRFGRVLDLTVLKEISIQLLCISFCVVFNVSFFCFCRFLKAYFFMAMEKDMHCRVSNLWNICLTENRWRHTKERMLSRLVNLSCKCRTTVPRKRRSWANEGYWIQVTDSLVGKKKDNSYKY